MNHLKIAYLDHNLASHRPLRRKLFRARQGSVAVLAAMSAPLLIIAIGLGIEATGWTVSQTELQRTADMAAMAGVLSYSAGSTAQTASLAAAYVAEINGGQGATARTWNATTRTLSDNMVTVAVTAGVKNASDVAFVTTVQATLPLFFSAIALTGTSQTLSATATAELTTSQIGKDCILALDSSSSTSVSTAGIDISNGAAISLPQCGIQINASGADALYLTGGATLTAASVSVVGGYSMNNGASMTVSGSTTTGGAAVTNPYASVAIPTPGSCAGTNAFFNTTISPGTYCNGLTIQYGTVTMNPGVYIVDSGSFTLAGGSTVNASGVTIVLTGTSSSNIATAQIANGTTFNITAPTTGSTRGLAIIQDPRASSTSVSNMAGGTTMNVTGALDVPGSIVDFSNGSSNTSSCTQLIALQIQFTGGAKFGNNCSGTGTSGIAPNTSTSLVE